jgi:hypothetical protein
MRRSPQAANCRATPSGGAKAASRGVAIPVMLGLIVLAAARVSAQSAAAAAENVPGPPIPGLVFTPSVGVGVIHDDNPVLASQGDPSPDDVIAQVRPGFDLSYRAKHLAFQGGYTGAVQRYRTLDVYDSYDQGAYGEYRQQLSRRVSLFGRDSFSLTPTTDLVMVAGVPFTRTGTTHNNLSAGVTADVAKHLRLRAEYDFLWLRFNRTQEPVSPLLEGGLSHSVLFALRRGMSSRVDLGVDYSLQRALIGESSAEREPVTIQNTEGVVTYRFSPTLSMEAGAGISRLVLPDPDGTHLGPAGHFALRKRTEYAYFSLSTMRSFVPSFGLGGSLKNQSVTASARVPFDRQRAFVESTVGWNESQPVFEGELGLKSLIVQTTVSYSFERWVRLEAFYTGTFQDSTAVGGRVNRNRIGIQAVTGYPMMLR